MSLQPVLHVHLVAGTSRILPLTFSFGQITDRQNVDIQNAFITFFSCFWMKLWPKQKSVRPKYVEFRVINPRRCYLFVANYAESRLPQGYLNQPDVAFCFTYAGIYPSYKFRLHRHPIKSPASFFLEPTFLMYIG
jgi:hypothetical protein